VTIYIHPNFTISNLRNDIAILRLSSFIPLGQYPTIGTICLPSEFINFILIFSILGTCCLVLLRVYTIPEEQGITLNDSPNYSSNTTAKSQVDSIQTKLHNFSFTKIQDTTLDDMRCWVNNTKIYFDEIKLHFKYLR